MLKNTLCFGKAGKIAAALGAPPSDLRAAIFPLNLRVILSTVRISQHR